MIEFQTMGEGENTFYRAQIGQFELDVHHHIRYTPDFWLCSMEGVFNNEELGFIDDDAAKAEAVEMVRQVLSEALDAMKPEFAPGTRVRLIREMKGVIDGKEGMLPIGSLGIVYEPLDDGRTMIRMDCWPNCGHTLRDPGHWFEEVE